MASPLDKYRKLENIGYGAYGTVFKAENLDDHQLYAVKQIKQSTEWHKAYNMNELKSFYALKYKSAYIVRLHELFCVEDSVYLVFELIVGGSLYDIAYKHHFSADEAFRVLFDILRGMQALHAASFMHRDIKPENIMFYRAEQRYKLGDLGCARRYGMIGSYTDYVGTRWYRAPELLLRYKRYDGKVDVFSAGLVICELLLGKPIISASSELAQAQALFALFGISYVELEWFHANCGCHIECQVSKDSNSQQRIYDAILRSVRQCNLQLAQVLSRMLYLVPDKRCSCVELLPYVYRMCEAGESMTYSLALPRTEQVYVEPNSYKSEYIKQVKKVDDNLLDNGCLDDW